MNSGRGAGAVLKSLQRKTKWRLQRGAGDEHTRSKPTSRLFHWPAICFITTRVKKMENTSRLKAKLTPEIFDCRKPGNGISTRTVNFWAQTQSSRLKSFNLSNDFDSASLKTSELPECATCATHLKTKFFWQRS